MGTLPHTPLPPLDTLVISLASAPATPLYFLDTSIQDGPTIFLSIEWQAMQPFFFAKGGMSVANALPAIINPAAAILTIIGFMISP
jgi:hypothetical protein